MLFAHLKRPTRRHNNFYNVRGIRGHPAAVVAHGRACEALQGDVPGEPVRNLLVCPVKRRATRISHLCKSGGTYGNSLRLVRPTDPCWRKLRAIRRTHRVGLAFGRFPGICGSFLRPAPLTCSCFRRHVAIPRIGHPDHGPLGPRPVRPE